MENEKFKISDETFRVIFKYCEVPDLLNKLLKSRKWKPKVNSIFLEVLSSNLLANDEHVVLYLVGLDDETIAFSDSFESFLDVISVNTSTAIVNQDRSEA